MNMIVITPAMPPYAELKKRFPVEFSRVADPQMIELAQHAAGLHYVGVLDKSDHANPRSIWNHIHETEKNIDDWCVRNDVPEGVHKYLRAVATDHEIFDKKSADKTRQLISQQQLVKTGLPRHFVSTLFNLGVKPRQGYVLYADQILQDPVASLMKSIGDLAANMSSSRSPIPESQQTQKFKDKRDYLYEALDRAIRLRLSGLIPASMTFADFLRIDESTRRRFESREALESMIARNSTRPITPGNWWDRFLPKFPTTPAAKPPVPVVTSAG